MAHIAIEPTLSDLVGRLADDAKDYGKAEVVLQRARVNAAITRYKKAVIYFAVAGILALAALIALLVGLILTLSTLIGPGLATLVVIGVTVAIAAVLGAMGRGALREGSAT